MAEYKEFSHSCSDQNIQLWLKDVFREDIPSFEETPEFIEALKKIMKVNEAAEKDAKIIIKAEKNMTDLYNEKADELQLVTDFIQLNSETCRRVQSLAMLAEGMKLEEPSLTNFVLAMTEIEDKEAEKAEKSLVNSHHVVVFSKKINNAMKRNEKLRRHLKSLDKVISMQKTHNSEITEEIKYFVKKKNEVEKKIPVMQNKLKEAGHSSEIHHSALVKMAQELNDLDERKKTLENKLQAYHSLPANLAGTVSEVNTKENELSQLNEEFQMLLHEFETS